MWSATTETSDNKKREDVEDCKCSSSRTAAAAAAATTTTVAADVGGSIVQQQKQQQPQQLNVFENNSKKETASPFGANFTTHTAADDEGGQKADKKLAGSHEAYHTAGGETGDSGFISGPQTTNSNIFTEQDKDVGGVGAFGSSSNINIASNFNISATPTPTAIPTPTPTTSTATTTTLTSASDKQHQQKQQSLQASHLQEEEKIVLDSGCIDEDFTEDYIDDVGKDDDARQVAVKQVHEQQQQVERELASTAVASASTAEAAGVAVANSSSNSTTSTTAADQMILKNNVDAGMSQWFCNLSLQTDASTRPQQQQQQQQQHHHPQQVAGIGMNNLDVDIGGRRSLTTSAVAGVGNALSYNQNSNRQQQQQQAAGNSATNTNNSTTTTPITNITPSNAWEQFYQQNDDGDTPLHLACISGFADVVAALIRMAPHPCLFNIQNDEAQTPLHLAALTAQPKILRMLLIAGAEPTIRDRHGNTALHLACISGEEQCVRALTIPISASEINEAHRQYGHRSNDETVSYLKCASLPSDLEIRNYDGERCVHLAAQAGHIDILRILVLYGADINAREGKSGRTPLHIAIECCNEDLANFLLDECQKLNLETATYAGLTAYQVACILNKSQMQNILEKRGAEPLTPPDSDYDSSDIETDLDDSKIYNRFGDPGYFVGYNGGNPMTVA